MGALLVCPECNYEWSIEEKTDSVSDVIRDAVGNILKDGDSVTIIKDLKVKGTNGPLKIGTKASNIRLVPENGDHDLEAKVEGFGQMMLKSSVVKRA